MKKVLIFVLLFAGFAGAQQPIPTLPRVYIDTTWNAPTGGTTWRAHTSTDFANALNSALPGDIITLDAGSVYTGNFVLPAKINPNQKWIYIESSALASLPAPGTQVSPGNSPSMPKVTTTNTSSPFTLAPGANHYRLVGLEITSTRPEAETPATILPATTLPTALFAGLRRSDWPSPTRSPLIATTFTARQPRM
jgi:hypothetical protein